MNRWGEHSGAKAPALPKVLARSCCPSPRSGFIGRVADENGESRAGDLAFHGHQPNRDGVSLPEGPRRFANSHGEHRRGRLLHPVVITPAGRLSAGQRRLDACRQLGWTDVPVTVAPIRIAKGDIVGVVLVFRDITDRKKAGLTAVAPLFRPPPVPRYSARSCGADPTPGWAVCRCRGNSRVVELRRSTGPCDVGRC